MNYCREVELKRWMIAVDHLWLKGSISRDGIYGLRSNYGARMGVGVHSSFGKETVRTWGGFGEKNKICQVPGGCLSLQGGRRHGGT